jgi:hypothetical protein
MNKQQLASKIWVSANQMRSKIEASDLRIDNELKRFLLEGGFDVDAITDQG